MKYPQFFALLLLSGSLYADDFNPRQVVKPFEPIMAPEITTAKNSAKWVNDDELVLGVTVANESRAYPINQLTKPTREIINDTLGDQPIAATW